jgi:predicted transposase/invertase (TIGR01784 family)
MLKLWQEFLTSINAKTGKEEITDELLENTEVKEALDLCLDLTEEERGYYDGFWGMEFLRNDRDKTVREMSLAEGEAKGLEKGRAEGEKQANLATARKMRSKGYPAEIIAELTGLTESEIYNLN